MYVKNNSIANQLYNPYQQNIRGVSQSARRLSTGEKMPTAEDGGGELGVAEKWAQRHRGTSKLVDGMTNTLGFVRAQDETLNQVMDIAQRMSELTASALDISKTTADRIALDQEVAALNNEFSQLQDRRYNGISLFGNNVSVRIGLETTEKVTLTQISITTLSFTVLNISQLAVASVGLASINAKMQTLNRLRADVGNNANEVNRLIDYSRDQISHLKESESAVRDIDLATETGEFTKKQVLLAASQSVIAQSNGLTQSAQQFL